MKQNIRTKEVDEMLAIHDFCQQRQKTVDINAHLDNDHTVNHTKKTLSKMVKIGALKRIQVTPSVIYHQSIDCDLMELIGLNFVMHEKPWWGKKNVVKTVKKEEPKPTKKAIKNNEGKIIGYIRTIEPKHPTRNRVKAEWRGIGSSFNIV